MGNMTKTSSMVFIIALLFITIFTVSGNSAFSDSHTDAWYARYFNAYVNSGLAPDIGSYNDFDPDEIITNNEMLTVCARMHNILSGGDGDIDAKYEDRPDSLIYFTDIEGNKVAGYTDVVDIVESFIDSAAYYFYFSDEKNSDLRNNIDPIDTLVYHLSYVNKQYKLTYVYDGDFSGSYYLEFTMFFMMNEDNFEYIEDFYYGLPYSRRFMSFIDETFIDSLDYYISYYGYAHSFIAHLQERRKADTEIARILQSEYADEIPAKVIDKGDEPCRRAFLARNLALLIPEEYLQPVRDFGAIPDLNIEVLRQLYNAGILGGIDATGTFDGHGVVTRAQLAAIIARVIEPGLRLK